MSAYDQALQFLWISLNLVVLAASSIAFLFGHDWCAAPIAIEVFMLVKWLST